MTNDTTSTVTATTTAEQAAIELRKSGATYDQIRDATGLNDRQIKELVKGVPKPLKTRQPVSKIETPFAKSIERVFPLASRKHGIRDYELRSILHQEYGSKWNTSTGRYESNYTSDHIKRVKAKVRKQAAESDCNALFLTDWIDEYNPRASSDFLINAASDLMNRLDEYVTEYIASHGTMQEVDSQEGVLARTKQRYAVRQYLLKLAVKRYGEEPLEKLLERTATLVGELEGTPDIEAAEDAHRRGTGESTEAIKYYPEPSRHDAFLDFVQAQGWTRR
ncbi:hypothetical protein IB252_06195 [Pseudomonas sp. PDM10]|uniref:hypothetical protein n=1 Tax=Pseudomonas sp. PDM10 TaxID=2769269 RepID=UPI0017814353|nr:hypothetical protein [Pseudomonas sp. PDM10]MBD9599417.1 hypothetical protein [Pseudomonas sp. PDM10]